MADDLLVHATLTEDEGLQSRMQAFLLADFPDSHFSQYLLKSLEEKDFRELVQSLMSQHRNLSHAVRGRRVQGILKLALGKFPTALFDESLARTSSVVGLVEGDLGLQKIALQWLQSNKKGPGEVLSMALDQERSAVQKVEALIPLAEDDVARYLLQHLLASCADDAQHPALVARVEVVNLAIDGRIGEAIPLFEQLPNWTDDPQLAFLHVWALIAAGRPGEALEDYKLLRQNHADSQWTPRGADLTECLRQKESLAGEFANWAQAVEQSLREDRVQRVELELELEGGYEVYAAVDPGAKFFDVAVLRRNQQVARLRRDQRWLSLYRQSEGWQIQQWDLGEEVDATLGTDLKFNFSENEEGEFDYGLKFKLGGAEEASPPLAAAIEALQQFNQPDRLTRFLDWRLRHGEYCVIQPDANGDRVVRLGTCSPVNPEPEEFRCVLSTSGVIKALDCDWVNCRRILFGRRDDLTLKPPPWPEGPTQRLTTEPLLTLISVGINLVTEMKQMWPSSH